MPPYQQVSSGLVSVGACELGAMGLLCRLAPVGTLCVSC